MAKVLCVDGLEREDTPEQAELRSQKLWAVNHPEKFAFNGLPYARASRKGAANLISRKMREAVMAANEIIGRRALQKAIKEGDHEHVEMCVSISETSDWSPNLVAFFLELFRREPRTYGAIIARMMPMQITGADGGPINLIAGTKDELIANYEKLGIPVPESLRPTTMKMVEGEVLDAVAQIEDSNDDHSPTQ